jgi:uncharacterized lipoprotein YmbA
MKKLLISAVLLALAGCSTFTPSKTSQLKKHPTELDPIYKGGG